MIPVILIIGIALVVVLILIVTLGKRGDTTLERIKIYTSSGVIETSKKEKEEKENLFDRIDTKIEKKSISQKIQNNLQKADLPFRISEYLLLIFFFTALGMLLGYLLGKVIGMIIMGFAGYRALPFYVNICQKRRQRQFQEQLESTLTLISNGLKSGYSFLQTVDMVARETSPPMSTEFYKVLRETSLGLSLEDALTKLASRMESDDFDMVVTSVIIQRQTGGNLAEILDNIGTTIRERVRLRGEINALTAMGRMSGSVVSSLPFGLAILLYFMNPEYMVPFFASLLGKVMIGIGLVMMFLGKITIKKIISIEV